MKIRFLTLTPQQFAEGPASSSLLSQSEKFAILMNISSPSIDIPMPEGFSTSTVCRRKKIKYTNRDCNHSTDSNRNYNSMSRCNALASTSCFTPLMNENRKLYCVRELLQQTNIFNQSVLDCSVTVTVDKNICIYGIQVSSYFNYYIGVFNINTFYFTFKFLLRDFYCLVVRMYIMLLTVVLFQVTMEN